MSSISNTRSTPSIDLLGRNSIDLRKPAPKDKGALSATTPQGLSLARNTNGTTGNEAAQSSTQKARMAAEGLVSTTFIEPILKQLRESNNTPPPFGPGKAEKQFATLLDTKLADEIVRSANFPLVERITAQLLQNMPAESAPQQMFDTKG